MPKPFRKDAFPWMNDINRMFNQLLGMITLLLLHKLEKKMQARQENNTEENEDKGVNFENLKSFIEKMNQRLEEQNDKINSLNTQIETLKNENSDLKQESSNLKGELKLVKANNEVLQEKVKKLKSENTILKLAAVKGEGISDEESGSFVLKPPTPRSALKIQEEEPKGPKVDYSIDISDSVFYYGYCKTQKRNEENLRWLSYEGKVEQIRTIIDKREVDLNGRGMTWTLCGGVHGFGNKTPLMLACQKGHLETVKLLTRSGANVFLVDSNGLTAFDYALQNNHERICNFLKVQGAKGQEATPVTSPIMSPRINRKENIRDAQTEIPMPTLSNGQW